MGLNTLDNSRLPLKEQQFLRELATFDPDKHYLTIRLRVVSKKGWSLLRKSLCPCLFNPRTVAAKLFQKVDAVGLGRLQGNPGFERFIAKMEAHTALLEQESALKLTPNQVAGLTLRRLSSLQETYLYASRLERQQTTHVILLCSRLDYLQASKFYISQKERDLLEYLRSHLDQIVNTVEPMTQEQADDLARRLFKEARVLACFLEGCRLCHLQPETYHHHTPHQGTYRQFRSSF